MKNYRYLIIGGGMAADAAVNGIREADKNSSIGVISADNVEPYSRPPLSKGLWKNGNEEKLWKKTSEQNADIILNTKAKTIEPSKHNVTDSNGNSYNYEKLLIATGGSPIQLNGNNDLIYYRNYSDYKKLKELTDNKNKFLIIGGGFIGSEIAAALCMNGKEVTMIFPGKYIAANIFPSDAADHLTDYYRKQGIRIIAEDKTTSVEKINGSYKITTDNGKNITADVVIAGIGIKPNTSIAEKAGLKTDNGITVNEYLITSEPDIYAAGDNTNFFNPSLNERLRVEHEDNALKMGKIAGLNMTGQNNAYHHLPFFYSDLFDIGYEAVGKIDSRLSVYADWKEPYKTGVIYYTENKLLKGVLLWNVWDQVDNARKLIEEKKKIEPESLKERIQF